MPAPLALIALSLLVARARAEAVPTASEVVDAVRWGDHAIQNRVVPGHPGLVAAMEALLGQPGTADLGLAGHVLAIEGSPEAARLLLRIAALPEAEDYSFSPFFALRAFCEMPPAAVAAVKDDLFMLAPRGTGQHKEVWAGTVLKCLAPALTPADIERVRAVPVPPLRTGYQMEYSDAFARLAVLAALGEADAARELAGRLLACQPNNLRGPLYDLAGYRSRELARLVAGTLLADERKVRIPPVIDPPMLPDGQDLGPCTPLTCGFDVRVRDVALQSILVALPGEPWGIANERLRVFTDVEANIVRSHLGLHEGGGGG